MAVIVWAGVLALLWSALQGRFTADSLLLGFLVSLGILALVRPRRGARANRPVRVVPALGLVLATLRELVLSNLVVLRECLRPRPLLHRAVLAVPLECDNDAQIMLLANLVTLTPGTLSLWVADDRRALYIHALFASAEAEPKLLEGIRTLEALVRRTVP